MQALLVIPMVATALAGTGFLANEWSHGGLSEAMGMGHHHMLDFAGMHCAAHGDPALGAAHMAHMHGNASMPHDGCPGGPGMHRQGMMGTGNGTMMGGGTMGGGTMGDATMGDATGGPAWGRAPGGMPHA